MRMLPLAVLSIGAVLATNAVAQPAPPPPAPAATSAAPSAPDDAAAPPPPPPPGPRAERRPPPPPVPGIVVDRGPTGTFHVDLRCSPQDPIRECAAIATQMIDKLNGAVQPK